MVNIGDTVTPITNVIVNGGEVPTEGEEGTVVTLELAGADPEKGEDLYDYQVQFPEALEGETITGSLFWFSSEELGISEADTPSLDLDTINANIAAAQTTSNTAITVMSESKDSLSEQSLFTSSVDSYVNIAQTNDTTLTDSVIDESDNTETVRQASAFNKQAELLGNDQLLFQEVVENLAELDAVLAERQQELQTRREQAEEQQTLATTSSEEDHTIYMNTVANNPNNPNPLVPLEEGEEYIEHPTNETEDDEITSNMLVSLDPEQEDEDLF